MRVGDGNQSSIIAAQLLTSSSANSGPSPTSAASLTDRDSVKFSDQAKKIADRIAHLANQVGADKDGQTQIVVAVGAENTEQSRSTSTSTSSDTEAAHRSSYADDLRSGQDGHAKIIEGMEETLLISKILSFHVKP